MQVFFLYTDDMFTPDEINRKLFSNLLPVGSIPDMLMRQLVFIAEVDKIKLVLRRTLLTDGSRPENDAEHSWHLALMAVLLESYASGPVDMTRVLTMVIIHDLIEIYAGDTFAFDVEGNKDKVEREKNAADRLFRLLDGEQGTKLRSLWEEFDRMDTDDSRFAASLDRLQPFIHNVLTDGHTWKLGVVTKSQVCARMEPVRTGLPAVWPWIEAHIERGVKNGWIKEDVYR